MKILHTSDWHLGMRIGEYNLLDDQRHMLDEIIRVAQDEQPDVILIAGDIYDKSVPSAEAILLLDEALCRIAALGKEVFLIAGNHDSAERLSYASRLIALSRIHLSPLYDGTITPVVLNECGEDVAIYMLPYLKPAMVRHYADEEGIETYDDAMRYVIQNMDLGAHKRNILVAHQYISDSERTDSEDMLVGGLDQIDRETLAGFDYVALGHLHRAQNCGTPSIRYCGTPMKYSFSEVNDSKSVTIVELPTEGEVVVRERPLRPLHEWYDLRGRYDELTNRSFYADTDYPESYVRITLTDEEDVPNGQRLLKAIYHRLVELRYDNTRTRMGQARMGSAVQVKKRPPIELMDELFLKQNGRGMSDEQKQYMQTLIERVFG